MLIAHTIQSMMKPLMKEKRLAVDLISEAYEILQLSIQDNKLLPLNQ